MRGFRLVRAVWNPLGSAAEEGEFTRPVRVGSSDPEPGAGSLPSDPGRAAGEASVPVVGTDHSAAVGRSDWLGRRTDPVGLALRLVRTVQALGVSGSPVVVAGWWSVISW